jgi:undecaprenyl diphosphate synthase
MDRLDKKRLPKHIAIIMDGNGRWAQKNNLGRISGHRAGAESVRVIVEACREIGIKYLTLYAFSVENWMRPSREVRALMNLLVQYLKSEYEKMIRNDIRLNTIGQIENLPVKVREFLVKTMDSTSSCRGMVLSLALSYGGRDEIVRAVKKIVQNALDGGTKSLEISKDLVSKNLDTAGIPDPDLLIRTSGEYRLSNFLLWQSAYTELYFTEVLWPDFRKENLIEAILDYQNRERRFGLTSEQLTKD